MDKNEITPEMIRAAFEVLNRYDVRDSLEIDIDIMRELLAAALANRPDQPPEDQH